MEDAHTNFSLLVLATQYMFNVTFAGMFAATIYFHMERNNLTPKYSVVASLCMMVVCIAAINYYHMVSGVGLDGNYATLSNFPTAFRYADWVLTTPLILSSLVMLTNSPNKSSLAAKLMIADAIMIILGYVGEVNTNHDGGGSTLSWICFLIACCGFVYILIVMYGELSEAASDLPSNLRSTFSFLQNFIMISWMVYPLGYLAPLLGYKGELLAVRELVYCIADLSAKVGFGILVVSLAKKLSLLEIEQREKQLQQSQ